MEEEDQSSQEEIESYQEDKGMSPFTHKITGIKKKFQWCMSKSLRT